MQGLVKLETLAKREVACVTDTTLWAAARLAKMRKKGQTIYGLEIVPEGYAGHVVLLAEDMDGWRTLCAVGRDGLKMGQVLTGVHLLTGGADGILVKDRDGTAKCGDGAWRGELLRKLRAMVPEGKLWVELAPTQGERWVELWNLANEHDLPVVATGDVSYAERESRQAWHVMRAIGERRRLQRGGAWEAQEGPLGAEGVAEQGGSGMGRCWGHLVSAAEMSEFFSRCPAALRAAADLAARCQVKLRLGVVALPDYVADDGRKLDAVGQVDELRRQAEEGLRERLDGKAGDLSEYWTRLAFELDVIAGTGFAGYFLIYADFVRWGKTNGVPFGPGRGCLQGDVPILMSDGTTKPIKLVKVGDQVWSHTGNKRLVEYVHRYPVKERLLKLSSFYGDSVGVTLTQDHEVLAEKSIERKSWTNGTLSVKSSVKRWEDPSGDLQWTEAKKLKIGDWVLIPSLRVKENKIHDFSLEAFASDKSLIQEDKIVESTTTNKQFKYSLNDVHRVTGVSKNSINYIISGHKPSKKSLSHDVALEKVSNYVCEYFDDIKAWADWLASIRVEKVQIPKTIPADRLFYRILGRWVADGWLRFEDERVIGLCFHSEDLDGQEETKNFFRSLNIPFKVSKHQQKKLIQIIARSSTICAFWRWMFPAYKSKPETKHIPDFVKNLPVDDLLIFLSGYWAGDGSVGGGKFTATSVSKRLMEEIRFLLLRCGIPTSIRFDDRNDVRFKTLRSFILNAYKDERISKEFGGSSAKNINRFRICGRGIMVQISKIDFVDSVDEVYDLTVERDSSYLTSSFAVHNSAAGSMVVWALGITECDPIVHGLLFERFLNPERCSWPDIDIDICKRRRGDVVKYLSDRYGRDSVGRIINFKVLVGKTALKDVGRAFGIGYHRLNALTAGVPMTVKGKTPKLSWMVAEVQALREAVATDPELARVVKVALELEGCIRESGVHASGIVVSRGPLADWVPTIYAKGGELCSAWDMREAEDAGLVKLDLLGLSTVTMIDLAERMAGVKVDQSLNDAGTFALMGRGDTHGVFQMGKGGFRRMLRELKPDRFGDVVAAGALYRPGPIQGGMVKAYCRRKHGQEKVEYIHPLLESVTGSTYACLTYQEQVMSSARVLAGYSLGEADILRRAMGKKKPEEMRAQRAKFVDGCLRLGTCDAKQASEIFDLIDHFSGYGFNVSHSTAYGMLSYYTGWLKQHHPIAFYAALLSILTEEADSYVKIAETIYDIYEHNIRVLPPDVNQSRADFTPEAGAVRYGLRGLRGLGKAAAMAIVAAQPFTSLADLFTRVKLGKRDLGSLIGSGALDALLASEGRTRAQALHHLPDLLAWCKAAHLKPKVKRVTKRKPTKQLNLLEVT